MSTAVATVMESQRTQLRVIEALPVGPGLRSLTDELALPERLEYRSRETTPWPWALGASVGLHLTVAALLLMNWHWKKPETDAPPAAIVVDLSVMPTSTPDPPTEVPPGPKQQQAAPKPKPQVAPKFDPPPQVDSSLKPDFAVPLKQESQPTETKTLAAEAREMTAPPSIEAPKDKVDKAPVEGSNAAPPSNAEQAWEGKILAKLERNKRYPAQAQSAGQEDTVMVRMILDRRGHLVNAVVVKSRAFAVLDNEVLQLARRSSPFPAPPESVTGDPIQLVVPVEFFLKSRR